ncbi:hypothetical protein NSZ01_33280 [Nocardioides szechwanensis]|uniref:Uncharacterized protein n=1 Tax=Nocardioides szechwanensis TaxID=1005944 RepID=A0A1H0KYW5_9ACTN|nr:hypothetical protein NSZ01_33280 [Nocardioides szechwanensis]SDO61138.1 hypothetical protein SAMN05192576_0130 [Nocardioides szechwanensis]
MIGLAVVVVLLVVALSPSFGRAEPTGNYRPDLAPDALDTGCYPLPEGLILDFPYQVRTDGDVTVDGEQRRELRVQYDVVGADEVVESLTASFLDAGFTTVTATGDVLTFERSDAGAVTATVTPLEDVPEDSIVRGTVVFDLPSVPLASDDPICDDPYATKRFPESYEPAE